MLTAQRAALVATVLLASRPAWGKGEDGSSQAPLPDYENGFSVGVRSGWGVPLGTRTRIGGIDNPMGSSGNFTALVPLWLDAGYRFARVFYVGGYFQYGFLLTAQDHLCPAPFVGCSAHDVRAGAAVHVHFMPSTAVDPWVGLGFGYEASTTTFEGVEQSATRSDAGVEFLNLQVGADAHPIFGLDWGPFGSFSASEYQTETISEPDGTMVTPKLPEKTFHYFLILGMRVQCDL